jgi:hypothetical protein
VNLKISAGDDDKAEWKRWEAAASRKYYCIGSDQDIYTMMSIEEVVSGGKNCCVLFLSAQH